MYFDDGLVVLTDYVSGSASYLGLGLILTDGYFKMEYIPVDTALKKVISISELKDIVEKYK